MELTWDLGLENAPWDWVNTVAIIMRKMVMRATATSNSTSVKPAVVRPGQ